MSAGFAHRHVEGGQSFNSRVPGVYVIRSQKRVDLVRVGAAGCARGGKGTLAKRFRNHTKPWSESQQDNETKRIGPYDILHVWELNGWPWYKVVMAEAALYQSVEEAGLKRYSSAARDNSHYIAPSAGALVRIVPALEQRLEKLLVF